LISSFLTSSSVISEGSGEEGVERVEKGGGRLQGQEVYGGDGENAVECEIEEESLKYFGQ
jgi:hypothetical protein